MPRSAHANTSLPTLPHSIWKPQRIWKAAGVMLALGAALFAADWKLGAGAFDSAEYSALAVLAGVAQVGIVAIIGMLVLLECD